MKSKETSKPEWYYNQSAVIPFRFSINNLEVLLITSLKRKQWIIPKGIIENELSAQESASKEAYEEAGLSGKIVGDVIGEYTYEKWGGKCRVRVFAFKVDRVHDTWPEVESRERKWFTIDKAIDVIGNKEVKDMLKSLKKFVEF